MSQHERLEDRLRAEAGAFRARSRTGLAGRTIERLREPGSRPVSAGLRAQPSRSASWLAAAAAVLLAALAARAWLGGRGSPETRARDTVDAELIVRPLGRLLELDLTPVGDALKSYRGEALVAQGNPLESEARKLWLDASRAAQEFASQLPSPLREALIPR